MINAPAESPLSGDQLEMRAGTNNGDAAGDVTRLLMAWREGDERAPRELFVILYEELRRLAHIQLRRRLQSSLVTTALVHEAYVKLADQARLDLRDRGHFLALAAKAMRQILLDHARKRLAGKRGGAIEHGSFDESAIGLADTKASQLVALDDALDRLEALDPRLARIVEVRFFAGLSVIEAADALGLSERTVKRDWQKARAFLYSELNPDAPS
jgi:RNA polymerase sigma factor (TIGR02999 family)